MRIETNIKSVIGQLERLKAKVPVAAVAALEPQHWLEPARQLASSILLSLATPQERRFIPGFIETISLVFQTGSLSFSIKAPLPDLRDVLTLEEAQAARSATSVRDMAQGLFEKPVQTFRDLIQQWVETPQEQGGKRRDARDWGKTDEEVAELISRIMLSPDMKSGSKMEKARNALWPHIADWLSAQQSNQLPPETVDLWLKSVLAGWRELVRINYPSVLRNQLRS